MSQVITQNIVVNKIPIDIKEFTDQAKRTDAPSNNVPRHTVSGLGIFDDLMETATEHLLAQYEGNRIKAEHYADAYVQIYQATLQAALKIWLEKGTADAQANLLLKQAKLTEAQTALAEKDLDLKDKQIALTAAQTANTTAQTALINAQKATEDKRPALIVCQTQLACAQAEAQDKQLDLIEKQIGIAEKQMELAAQQAESEKMKGKLYQRQIEGFDEDFKHKILKTLLDSWAVGFSVSKDSPTVSNIPSIISGNFITGVYNDRIASDLSNSTVRTS